MIWWTWCFCHQISLHKILILKGGSSQVSSWGCALSHLTEHISFNFKIGLDVKLSLNAWFWSRFWSWASADCDINRKLSFYKGFILIFYINYGSGIMTQKGTIEPPMKLVQRSCSKCTASLFNGTMYSQLIELDHYFIFWQWNVCP